MAGVVIPDIQSLLVVVGPLLIFGIAGGVSSVYGFIIGNRFERYLKKAKPAVWRSIFDVPTVQWVSNPLRYHKYIFDNRDTNNAEVRRYKKQLRLASKAFLVFFALVILSLVYAVGLLFGGGFEPV